MAEKLLAALGAKALIELHPDSENASVGLRQPEPGATAFRISEGGLAALGIEQEEAATDQTEQDGSGSGDALAENSADAENATPTPPSTKTPRSGSKLASVIALLERPDGASLDELTTATGWLPHTARAALTGLRKRGPAVSRSRRADGVSCYVIGSAAPGSATTESTVAASDQQPGVEAV